MFRNRIIFILLTACIVVLSAHSGRTDKYGGHNNRKTGGYHYHNAGSVHHAGNSYQNHNTCGICTKSKKYSSSISKVPKTTTSINSGNKDKILIAQSCLNYLGYDVGTVDGKIGYQTTTAIRQYQKSKGLKVTGKTDKTTVESLLNDTKEKIK